MKHQTQKLFIITRNDLSNGQRAVQATHAAINFIFEHPGRAGSWFEDSNYLVLLAVDDEKSLKELIKKCNLNNIKVTIFKEPDIENQITAIAIEPGLKSQKLVSKLPLLFKINHNETE